MMDGVGSGGSLAYVAGAVLPGHVISASFFRNAKRAPAYPATFPQTIPEVTADFTFSRLTSTTPFLSRMPFSSRSE